MPTQNDYCEALLDGRWQPELKHSEKNGEYIVSYKQGETVVERTSKYSFIDAEDNLRAELMRGALEGEYFPEG